MERTETEHFKSTISAETGRQILTVSEITRDIKTLLETGFEAVWVKGEVSSFKVPGSGHFYFSLKDESALLACVMFRFKNQYLKFDLKEGLEVICGGRITLYEPRGNYQLLIDVIEPVGLGALQLQFEQLKEKLKQEGLFDPLRKKPIPYLPQKIALITSPTGAAIRDMLQIINRRFSNVEILLVPVAVQGEKAAPEIVGAIKKVNALSEHDVIILGRGGGSLEDLWAFNEEIVARAIFSSKIPIVSAVGHEIDFTIADFVADLRASTPSAAAELVVKNKSDLKNHLLNHLQRIRQAYLKQIHFQRNALSEISGRLIDPRRRLADWRLRLSDLEGRLHYTLLQNIKNARALFEKLFPSLKLQMKHLLERREERLQRLQSLLHSLNPLAILERGYSITTKLLEQTIVRSFRDVKVGDQIKIQLFEGNLICDVKKSV